MKPRADQPEQTPAELVAELLGVVRRQFYPDSLVDELVVHGPPEACREHVQRYFEESESDLPAACPQCTGQMRHRCPACNAPFSSAFAVECEECGGELRPNEQFGVKIRRET